MAVLTSTEDVMPALPESEPPIALRVLLIDDDLEALDRFGDLLGQTPMEVAWYTASGYDEALTAVKLGGHDAYLVDARLGARSGLELIRETAALATGPMILLTGVGDENVDATALAAGAADYLSKDELTPSNLQRSLRYSVDTWRARREAADRNERYLSLFDGVPVGLFRMTPDTHLVDVNATAVELLGYGTKADLVGHNAKELFVRPDQINLAVEGGTISDLDVELRRNDGGTLPVNLSLREMRDELGNLTHYEGAIFDVTLRKDAESRVQMRGALLDQVPSAVIVTDLDGVCTFWNSHAEVMYGWSTTEAIGRPIYELTVIENEEEVAKEIMEAIAVEGHWAGEFMVRRRDGSVFPAQVSNSLLLNANGEPEGVVGVSLDLTQTKEAEATLSHYQELLAEAFDSSPIGKAIGTVPDGLIISANPALCSFLGYESDRLEGIHFVDVTHPDDIAVDMDQFGRLLSGLIDNYTIDKRFIRADGVVVWGRLQVSLMHNIAGDTKYVLGDVIDITETKRAEDVLAFQASLLDQIRTPIVVTDRRGRVTYWNPQAEIAYGYASPEAMGKTLLELVVPDADATLYREVRESLARRGVWQGEVTITRKDGGRYPALASAAAVTDGTGRPQGVVSVIVDLSEVHTAEAETRTQEALNRSLLESVGVPIAILDRDARVIAWNPSWDEHVGSDRTPGDEGGLANCMPGDALPEDVAAVRESVGRLLGGDSGVVNIEYSLVRDLETRHWQMTAVQAGEEGALVAHWDVTDELSARSALEDTIRAKDEFIASISHELRSPLSVIVGLSEIVRTGDLPAVELSELQGLIADQAQEMALIVEDLLVAGRMESETLTIQPVNFDVAIETNKVLKGWQTTPGLDLQINFEPGTFSAHADTLRFRQVVRNLVNNAVRHGQPPVIIDARQEQDHLVVEVSDRGAGVPSESVHRMFQPYAHFASPRGQPSSIGLGLHVARRLARLMGGELTYRREADRTVFALSLPSALDKARD